MKNRKLSVYCEMCGGDGVNDNKRTEASSDSGEPLFYPCGFCNGIGLIPTEFGIEILSFLKDQLPEIWDNLKKQK